MQDYIFKHKKNQINSDSISNICESNSNNSNSMWKKKLFLKLNKYSFFFLVFQKLDSPNEVYFFVVILSFVVLRSTAVQNQYRNWLRSLVRPRLIFPRSRPNFDHDQGPDHSERDRNSPWSKWIYIEEILTTVGLRIVVNYDVDFDQRSIVGQHLYFERTTFLFESLFL